MWKICGNFFLFLCTNFIHAIKVYLWHILQTILFSKKYHNIHVIFCFTWLYKSLFHVDNFKHSTFVLFDISRRIHHFKVAPLVDT